ncbi:MAG: hypothetical protein P4L34_01120 [Paludibacter sp.]|nr:hypothetical protein [Paludibacter sp.]
MNRNKLFLSIYAVTTRIIIDIVGKLMLAEVIALVTFPFINKRKLIRKYKGLRIVIVSLLVLLLAQIVSDLFNNSIPTDYLRGWALMLFSIVSTIFLVNYISKNNNGIIYYLFFLFVIRLLFGNSDLSVIYNWAENTNIFKSRFVVFLNPLLLVISYYLFSLNIKRITAILFMLYGFICISLDARSNGLIFIVSSFILYLKIENIRFTYLKIFGLILFIGVVFYLAYIYYVNQVLFHGFGGSNAFTQLSRSKNPYNPFELIYHGRTDFFVLIQAIIDKPILGHGSWAKDPNGIYMALNAKINGMSSYKSIGYIPAHSVLLGSWAYAGIIGFIATLFMFVKLFRYYIIIINSKYRPKIYPILIVSLIDMIWAFLFSPLGLLRTTFPIFAALIIVEYERFNKYNKMVLRKQNYILKK